jgi:hypothetical protein
MHLHAGQQRERAILELHHDALERRLRLVERELEQLEDDRLVAPEHVARGDAEEQAVADLACGAGDGDADGWFHRELLWKEGRAGSRPAAPTVLRAALGTDPSGPGPDGQ